MLPTLQEKISSLTTDELIQITEELQNQFIPLDALVRKVCTEVYVNRYNKVEKVTSMEMTLLAPHIAFELGRRIKALLSLPFLDTGKTPDDDDDDEGFCGL